MEKKKRISELGIKIAAVGAAIILMFAIVNGALIYYTAKISTERSITNYGIDVAKNIAEQMDAEEYQTFLNEKTENERYWKLRGELNDFREKSGVLYVYTLYVTDNEDVAIVVDGMPRGADDTAEIDEVIDVTTIDHVAPVLKGQTSYSEIVKDPLYGDYLSAFTPIVDQSGDVIGILGVDIDAAQVSTITNNVMMNILPILIPLFIVIIIISITVLIFYVMRSIKPINDIEWIAKQIAQGDIQAAKEEGEKLPVHRKDEIGKLGKSFQHMIEQLEDIIKHIQGTAEHVAASSEELYASAIQSIDSNEQIRDSIKEAANESDAQLRSTNESAESMEDMAKGAQQIADAASTASDASVKTLTAAEEGKQSVDQVLAQIDLIAGTSDEMDKVVQRLDVQSNEIAQILTVIIDIAEQTNLLALNAAIEAARAGEYGKGFAVVSEEIRNLADQSKASVEQISNVIHVIQSDMKEALTAMEAGKQETINGQQIARETGASFEHILKEIKRVTNGIQEVSASSEQMAASSEEVSALIGNMEELARNAVVRAQEVATSTDGELQSIREITHASKGLSEVAQDLHDAIQKFKI